MDALKRARAISETIGDGLLALEEDVIQVWNADCLRFRHEFCGPGRGRAPSGDELCAVYQKAATAQERRHVLLLLLQGTSVYFKVTAVKYGIAPVLASQQREQADTLVQDLTWILPRLNERRFCYAVFECLKALGAAAHGAVSSIIDFAEQIEPEPDEAQYIIGEICETLGAIDKDCISGDFLAGLAETSYQRGRKDDMNSCLYHMTVMALSLSAEAIEIAKRLLELSYESVEQGEHSAIASTAASRCLQIFLTRDMDADASRDLVMKGESLFPRDYSYAERQASYHRNR